MLSKRQEGTGLWLLESEEFQEWFGQPGKTMLCSGIPGAGKTIIAATVIDHLREKFRSDVGVSIAYVYFSYQPKQE